MPAETELKNQIMLNLDAATVRVFKFQCGDIQLADGRWISIGVPGMSDLMGFVSVEITPEMIGKRVAIFTAIEVKAPKGRISDKQVAFINLVQKFGGRAGFAFSVEDAKDIAQGNT